MPPLMRWATPPALPSTHDLQGAEVLLAQIAVDTLIADKASMHMNGLLSGSNETVKRCDSIQKQPKNKASL
jgi:hypothetical protein